MACEQYNRKGIARIDETAPPVVIQSKRGNRVTGFIQEKGLPDFVGYVHGRGVALDAKTTRSRTSFELRLIKRHQLDYLLKLNNLGHYGFFLVRFEKLDEVYRLPAKMAKEYFDAAEDGGRKSIPYNEILLHCQLIKSKNGVVLDFLRGLTD